MFIILYNTHIRKYCLLYKYSVEFVDMMQNLNSPSNVFVAAIKHVEYCNQKSENGCGEDFIPHMIVTANTEYADSITNKQPKSQHLELFAMNDDDLLHFVKEKIGKNELEKLPIQNIKSVVKRFLGNNADIPEDSRQKHQCIEILKKFVNDRVESMTA